jgi:neutral ceramidase
VKAGTGRREITLPEYLIGDARVHDSLFASALVLDDGVTKVAVVCLDLVDPTFPAVRPDLRQQLGIDHTFINASHTHSDGRGRRKEGWKERVGELIKEVVREALANAVSVCLHAGRQPVQIGCNRYSKRFTDAIVPWVNTLEARTESGESLAVLFEHPAHPVMTIGGEGLSADFPGAAVARIREELGNDVLPLFIQGCAGNINAYPVGFSVDGGQHDNAARAGRILGEATVAALRDGSEITADTLSVQSTSLTLPCNLPSMHMWEEMVARLMRHPPGTPMLEGTPDSWTRHLDVVRQMIERGERPHTCFEASLLTLGTEWCLLALPGEMFGDYELWVEEQASFSHRMVSAYTNDGRVGYIPTDKALRLGAEEPLSAEHECMEATAWPGFFYGVNVRGAWLPYTSGIEAQIHCALGGLWAT